MADVKISQLPTASPLSGTELLELVQSGTNKKATVTQVAARVIAVSGISDVQADVSELQDDVSVLQAAIVECVAETDFNAAIVSKVDKVAGYGLSQTNFSQNEKDKLASLENTQHWKGLFTSLSQLQSSVMLAQPGDYAYVDTGVGENVQQYIWDPTDTQWVAQQGNMPDPGSLTASDVKDLYESNADTNAFTDELDVKLSNIEVAATANSPDAVLQDRANHTGTQNAATISDFAPTVLATTLTGVSFVTGTVLAAADTMLQAFGKLQKQINDLLTTVSGKQTTLISSVNIKSVGGVSLLGAGDVPFPAPPINRQEIPIACSDEVTAIEAGTSKVTFVRMTPFTLSGVGASLTTAQTSGSVFTVDIHVNGTSILSTKLTIDNTTRNSVGASVAAVLSSTTITSGSEITIDVDQVGDGTAKGLKVYLIGVPS